MILWIRLWVFNAIFNNTNYIVVTRFICGRNHWPTTNRQTSVSPLHFLNPSAVIRYLICVYASHFFARRPYHFNQTLHTTKNIGLWWRYGIGRHCDEWKYIIIGRIFESEIILIPPSLKISESSSNGSYRNTDKVWWRYGISRSCDEWTHYKSLTS
jgi:hypothetical protein